MDDVYQDENIQPIEKRLMALGAALVGVDDKAARIVADAMAHIAELQRQVCEHRRRESGRRDARARARRPR